MNSFFRHYRAGRRIKRELGWRAAIGVVLAIANLRCFAEDAATAKPDVRASSVQKEHPLANSPAAPEIQPTGPIQYVGPDTFILLDSQGRPQPVPGMTYEDFLSAWKRLNQPQNQEAQPRYTIERITFSGQANRQRAELKFEAVIHLIADGPTDVPLGLVGAILQGEAHFASGNDSDEKLPKAEKAIDKRAAVQYLNYDAQHGGFVAHFNTKRGAR
jgi:hypothetical protein